jgi:hypothetical protein
MGEESKDIQWAKREKGHEWKELITDRESGWSWY